MVKPEGLPQLCQTDEIGELCVCSIATGTSYYGLTGMTKNTFEVCVRRLFYWVRVRLKTECWSTTVNCGGGRIAALLLTVSVCRFIR